MTAKLAFESRGAGPTLVLLHAFPFDRRMWSHELARLSDVRRVVAVDLRGFGESPLFGEPTIDELADDVVATLDALGVPMASVCGLSMGGYVALSLAERHRARLAALVLADTRAAADGDVARLAREATMRQVRDDGPRAFLDGIAERLLSRHASDDLRARVRDLCVERSDTILAATRAMAHRPDRTTLLARIDCPTLVVCGGEDTTSPAPEMRSLAAQISDAEYVEIAGAGHLSNLEAPERFAEAVARFLAAHDV
jgi:pimeloyl-ACP methyl ester carboxylesterase